MSQHLQAAVLPTTPPHSTSRTVARKPWVLLPHQASSGDTAASDVPQQKPSQFAPQQQLPQHTQQSILSSPESKQQQFSLLQKQKPPFPSPREQRPFTAQTQPISSQTQQSFSPQTQRAFPPQEQRSILPHTQRPIPPLEQIQIPLREQPPFLPNINQHNLPVHPSLGSSKTNYPSAEDQSTGRKAHYYRDNRTMSYPQLGQCNSGYRPSNQEPSSVHLERFHRQNTPGDPRFPPPTPHFSYDPIRFRRETSSYGDPRLSSAVSYYPEYGSNGGFIQPPPASINHVRHKSITETPLGGDRNFQQLQTGQRRNSDLGTSDKKLMMYQQHFQRDFKPGRSENYMNSLHRNHGQLYSHDNLKQDMQDNTSSPSLQLRTNSPQILSSERESECIDLTCKTKSQGKETTENRDDDSPTSNCGKNLFTL